MFHFFSDSSQSRGDRFCWAAVRLCSHVSGVFQLVVKPGALAGPPAIFIKEYNRSKDL